MKRLTCTLCFLLLASNAFAGAWTQPKGDGYYKLGFRMVRANQFYDPDGRKIDVPTFGDYSTIFYGEHGLTDRITLVASVPFYKRITLNKQVGRTSGFVFFEGDSKTGIADSEVGARFGLLQGGSAVVSAELLFGLPIGDNDQENGLYTGDGEFNQMVKLQFGYSLYPRPIYFGSEIGFNNRTEGYSDEFYYAAEVGYNFGGKLLVSLKMRGIESFKNGNDAVQGGMGGLFANNQSYLTYGPEVSYLLNNNFAVVAGVEGATHAENVLSAPAFSFGFVLRRQ